MKVLNRNDEIIEWGQTPKEGMVLVGFSSNAVLERKDLKQEILKFLSGKEVGYRKAVLHFKKQSFASFDEAKRVVDEIKKDWGREKNQQKVFQKKYSYLINHIFWTYENNIPSDPRYSKLNVINMEKINLNNFINEDKSFDAEKFIRENISKEDIQKIDINRSKGLMHKESAPEDDLSLEDNEWNVNKD